jgi:DNA-binding response OmpR family regulator
MLQPPVLTVRPRALPLGRLQIVVPWRVIFRGTTWSRSLGPLEYDLFLLLAARPGRVVPRTEIVDTLYGDDPNGGPDDTVTAVGALCHKLNRKISCLRLIVRQQGFWARFIDERAP